VASLYITYSHGPPLKNPFNNHWQPGTTAVCISLGFLFGLATLAMIAQTYISVLVNYKSVEIVDLLSKTFVLLPLIDLF
jgi:hypothetical protein